LFGARVLNLVKDITPEEIELEKKRKKLSRLQECLVVREQEMADMRAELKEFEVKYVMIVGRLYAELDEVEAEIAEEEFRLCPNDEEVRQKAEEARKRAEESAAHADEVSWQGCNRKYNPPPDVKKVYHKLAKMIHPDLATFIEERERRHLIMAELNRAYENGDEEKMKKLMKDWQHNPDLIKGNSIGDELIRVIRQIAQVSKRLKDLKTESEDFEKTELYQLKEKVEAEMREGRNLLNQMANRAESHIKKAKRRLEVLRQDPSSIGVRTKLTQPSAN
jgi:peptidoglycan hydrolase CwlO-like protein